MTHRISVQTLLYALVIQATVASNAIAAIFTVGSGAGCSHGTIQSAINAANASVGADTIRLTRSLTYQPEANTINAGTNQNLNVVGGFATCTQAASDSIKTTVSGVGGALEPVFRITIATGTIVKLRHLSISGGDEDGGGGGGGINFSGDGGLEIIESTITNNIAGYGGGIFARATGSNAELVISDRNTISANTARYDGGGLYLAGPLEMTMVAPTSIIGFNEALGLSGIGGFGGGIHVAGPAIAYIGSSGLGGLGAIYGNSARDGGGISIISGNSDGADAKVYLYTTDPLNPATVRGNDASETGGAVYLQSDRQVPGFSTAHLCAFDFRIEDNAAVDGSAIYLNSESFLDLYSGSKAALNSTGFFTGCTTRPGALRCATGVPCNTVNGNNAVTIGGQPTLGATVRLLARSGFIANRFEMRRNRGGSAIRTSSGDFTTAILDTCLIADNQITRQLIRGESDSNVEISGCTLARNTIGSTDVLHSEESLRVIDSIIFQPGNLILAHSGPAVSLTLRNLLLSEIVSMPNGPTVLPGDPLFVDAANGNYRLRLASPAIDFAPPVVGDDRDLDNLPRDQQTLCVPDRFGVRDLGAYERQPVPNEICDLIFRDNFQTN